MPESGQSVQGLSSVFSGEVILEKINANLEKAQGRLVQGLVSLAVLLVLLGLFASGELSSLTTNGQEINYRPAIILIPLLFSSIFCYVCHKLDYAVAASAKFIEVLNSLDAKIVETMAHAFAFGLGAANAWSFFGELKAEPMRVFNVLLMQRSMLKWLLRLYVLMSFGVIVVRFNIVDTGFNSSWQLQYLSLVQQMLCALVFVVGLWCMVSSYYTTSNNARYYLEKFTSS